jgi:hypothetical protein
MSEKKGEEVELKETYRNGTYWHGKNRSFVYLTVLFRYGFFWLVTPGGLGVYQLFGGIYGHSLQGYFKLPSYVCMGVCELWVKKHVEEAAVTYFKVWQKWAVEIEENRELRNCYGLSVCWN